MSRLQVLADDRTGTPYRWKTIPDNARLKPHILRMASTHDPYVPASTTLAELTAGSVILGCVLGLVFAASSVYLALKVGLTVSASIPIAVGWTGIEHRVLALSIGGVVCVAAAVGGATSQDLKTGFLVGATPRSQQIALLFGVTTSALLIGGMISFLNAAKTTYVKRDYPGVRMSALETAPLTVERTTFRVGRLDVRTGDAPAGRYLLDEAGNVKFLIDPGIGGRETKDDLTGRTVDKLDSPKSQIMALVVDGILTQKLPWGLILIGAFIAIVIEVLGLPSLAVCVGVYLRISTSATIFLGGVVRWIIDRAAVRRGETPESEDSGPGVLFSSGLIAGGAILGVGIAALQALHRDDAIAVTHWLGTDLTSVTDNALVAMAMYVLLLAIPLYRVARRKAI